MKVRASGNFDFRIIAISFNIMCLRSAGAFCLGIVCDSAHMAIDKVPVRNTLAERVIILAFCDCSQELILCPLNSIGAHLYGWLTLP